MAACKHALGADPSASCRVLSALAKGTVDRYLTGKDEAKNVDDDQASACSRFSKKLSPSCHFLVQHVLDNVPPAPGDPWNQHDAMVKMKLCKEACKKGNLDRNRYCNQFPFDSDLVRLKSLPYINASWISGLLPSASATPDKKYGRPPTNLFLFRFFFLCFPRRLIITMGPLHPSSGVKPPMPDTCSDFWSMAWELGTKTVVMLCSVSPGYQVRVLETSYY